MNKKINLKILLVGCGKMGGALLSGWLKQNIKASNISVIEPQKNNLDIFLKNGVNLYSKFEDLENHYEPDFILFAVKPQMMDEIVPDYKYFSGKTTFISIAAGKTITYFESLLGKKSAIIRAMPNTPAAVGRGITALYPNAHVSNQQKQAAESLLSAVGETVWLDNEEQMDAVTALSGGGPAYVFLLIETMTKAGIAAGLPDDVAARLAHTTVCGAGELARLAEEPPEQLRKNVTSPGGTTLEALNVLMADDGIQPLFDKAIAAATRRSRELAG